MTDSVGKPTFVSDELLSRAKFFGVDRLARRQGKDGPRKVKPMTGAKHGGERALVPSRIAACLARERPETSPFREAQRGRYGPFISERDGGFTIVLAHTGNAKRDRDAPLAEATRG